MKEKLWYCLLLAVMFVGCTASDEYDNSSTRKETASEVLYKLAADYGISITLGPGFNTIPAENLDMSKVKEKFRQFASLKGTYYMLPQGQASKDGTVNYSCMKKKSRSRAMYSDEFDSGNVYNFASEKLDYGLTGYCRAEFMYSSYSKLCKVEAWIKESGKIGKSECNIKSEVKKII